MAESRETNGTPREKKRLSLSLKRRKGDDSASSSSKRFSSSSDQELETLKMKPVSKNTKRSQAWALNVFKEWMNGSKLEKEADFLWCEADKEQVCDLLCKFIAEAKQCSGEPYSPKTLLQLLVNLQSYASDCNPRACKFMDIKDPIFKPLHHVLNNLSKKLLNDGIGAKKKQARVVTMEEEETLWKKGVMGLHSPVALQNATFFYCGIYFCLRGGVEHRDLTLNQFELKEVPHPTKQGKTVKCITYTEHGSKNRQGLVHQVHLENKMVTHYTDPSLGERCFVYIFERYVSLLLEDAKQRNLFYCKPKAKFAQEDPSWYYNIPVGHNLLSRRLKDMFMAAGLNSQGINNHGLRASGITRMYAKGIPEKVIMERSGHLSIGGIRSYERTTESQKMEVLRVLASSSKRNGKGEDGSVAQCASEAISKMLPLSTDGEKENKMSPFNLQNLQGCTLNFNFKC